MHLRRYIVVVFLLAVAMIAPCQLRNNIYLSAEAEYAAMFDNQKLAKPWLGGGGGIGFGYEMQYRRFLMDVGVTAAFNRYMSKIPTSTLTYRAVDTDGDAFDFLHTYEDNKNVSDLLTVDIPLLFGSKVGSNMYFLLGGRVQLNVYGRTQVRSFLTTTAQYDDLIGTFEKMENHNLSSAPLAGDALRTRFGVNVALGGEIGYTFSSFTRETGFDVPRTNTQYRIGLFAYYGVLDIHPEVNGKKALGEVFGYSGGGDTPIKYSLTHVYLSNQAAEARINNLMVGLRFTVLFKLPSPKKCVICQQDEPLIHSAGGYREVQRLRDAQ